MTLNEKEKKIFNVIQQDFPITSRPYLEIAKNLGMEEPEVIEVLSSLIKNGIIRQIGPVFEPSKLGYVTTLVAACVPEESLDETAQLINRYNEVTHNYSRNHKYNLWFTLNAPSWERIKAIISEIKQKTKVKEIYSMPTKKMFKIKVKFDL